MAITSPASPFTPRKTYTELGGIVPNLPHALSVSLPTWDDVVGYWEGETRVLDAVKTGYPRFIIHASIQVLAGVCETKFGTVGERAMLFASASSADACHAFLRQHSAQNSPVRTAQYVIHTVPITPAAPLAPSLKGIDVNDNLSSIELCVVFLPADSWSLAKRFWQYTGNCMSSRLAERCLSILGIIPEEWKSNHTPPTDGLQVLSPQTIKRSWRYGTEKPQHNQKESSYANAPNSLTTTAPAVRHDEDPITADQTTYLDGRYDQGLPLQRSSIAKSVLRRRIAGALVLDMHGSLAPPALVPMLGESVTGLEQQATMKTWSGENLKKGGRGVTEHDVYLFATGMSAIWHAHQMAMRAVEKEKGLLAVGKSVCFGFPYIDTLKVLENFGPGCHFLGHGLDTDIDDYLIPLLRNTSILCLFCEFPSNPLLRSPNLPRLWQLANEYGFVLVVDETIGSFANVDVLQYVDVAVSSLTKVFSGEANVMGGSLVLNPRSPHYGPLKHWLESSYDEATFYYGEDAIVLEFNSREFRKRVEVMNKSAEKVAEFLRGRSRAYNAQKREALKLDGGTDEETYVIDEVFYPKWVTRENFDACGRRGDETNGKVVGGYGWLLSICFTRDRAAHRFFDSLRCEKGPSHGTNFTLACPFTFLAYYDELDWVESWGVPKNLVRVSVGLEDTGTLLGWFGEALEEASR